MALPPLNTLRVFEAAARHGSFVRAAQELHVTHGAVSRQIRQLEEALGVPLFERRNRAVFLTPAGEQLRGTTADAFAMLTDAFDRIARRATPSALVVSCEPTRLKLCVRVDHGMIAANSRIVSMTARPPSRGTMTGRPRKSGACPGWRSQVHNGRVKPA